MTEIKRPPEAAELIRTLNPEVPYKEFEAAHGVDQLNAIVAYIHELERAARNRDMWKGQVERQAEQIATMREVLKAVALILPHYAMKGDTASDDEALDAVMETVTEALAGGTHA